MSNGTEVLYEPDEERNYRAVIDPEKMEGMKQLIKSLKALAGALETIVKLDICKKCVFL
jgi:hypothetical protein